MSNKLPFMRLCPVHSPTSAIFYTTRGFTFFTCDKHGTGGIISNKLQHDSLINTQCDTSIQFYATHSFQKIPFLFLDWKKLINKLYHNKELGLLGMKLDN